MPINLNTITLSIDLIILAIGHFYLYKLVTNNDPDRIGLLCFVPLISLYPITNVLGGYSSKKALFFMLVPLFLFLLPGIHLIPYWADGIIGVTTIIPFLQPYEYEVIRGFLITITQIEFALFFLISIIIYTWSLTISTYRLTNSIAESAVISLVVLSAPFTMLISVTTAPFIFLWFRPYLLSHTNKKRE